MAAYEVPEAPADSIDQVYAGDDWSFEFRVGEQEGTDPVEWTDLSAWTITAMWRPKNASGIPAITLNVDMSDAATGSIRIWADENQTRAMGMGGVFDVQGKFGALDETFIWGRTTWKLDVTRV